MVRENLVSLDTFVKHSLDEGEDLISMPRFPGRRFLSTPAQNEYKQKSPTLLDCSHRGGEMPTKGGRSKENLAEQSGNLVSLLIYLLII